MKKKVDKRIVLAMLLYFTLLCGCFLANNAGLSIFLSRVGVKLFPIMFIVNAFVMIAMTCVYNLFADRINNFKITYLFFAIDIAVLLVLRAWLSVSVFYAPFILYIMVTTIINYATIQFWAMSDTVFSFMESKRLYSLIGAGGTLGTAIAGFSSKYLANLLHTENLLLLCAGMMAVCFVIIRAFQRYETAGEVREERKLDATKVFRDMGDGFIYVMKSRMFLILSLCVFCIYLLNFGIEYYFSDLVLEHFQEEDKITAFVGFWIGMLNVITLVIQFFFASTIISQFGVGLTGLLAPVMLFLSYLSLTFAYSLPAGVFARVGPAAVRFSLGNPVINIICYLADEKSRVKVRAFMNIFVSSLGMLIAGLLLNFVVKGSDAQGGRVLCIVLLVVSCVLIALAFLLKKSYRKSIFDLLHSSERVSLISYLNQMEFKDKDLGRELMRSLEKAGDDQAVLVMDLLLKTGFEEWKDVYDSYYLSFSPQVRCKFISVLGCVGDVGLLQSVAAGLAGETEEVQTEILQTADRMGCACDRTILTRLAASPNIRLAVHAGKTLFKMGDECGQRLLQDILAHRRGRDAEVELAKAWQDLPIDSVRVLTTSILTDGSPGEKQSLLRELRVIGDRSIAEAVVSLLKGDGGLDKEIFRLIERTADPHFVPVLVDQLAAPSAKRRQQAIRALLRCKEVPQSLLYDKLQTAGSIEAQTACVDALSALPLDEPAHREMLITAARNMLRYVYEIHLASNAVAGLKRCDELDLLMAALAEKSRKGITLILKMVALLKNDKTISLISHGLFASEKKHVDHAIESLFLLKEDEIINAVIPVTYVPYMSKVDKIAAAQFKIPRRTLEETLRFLVTGPDEWIRVAVLNLIRTLPEKASFDETVRGLAPGRNEVEKELIAAF